MDKREKLSEEERKKIIQEFEREFDALCEKFDVCIGGCGCCGSPFLTLPDNSVVQNFC